MEDSLMIIDLKVEKGRNLDTFIDYSGSESITEPSASIVPFHDEIAKIELSQEIEVETEQDGFRLFLSGEAVNNMSVGKHLWSFVAKTDPSGEPFKIAKGRFTIEPLF